MFLLHYICFVAVAVTSLLNKVVPIGYEDANGFHYGAQTTNISE